MNAVVQLMSAHQHDICAGFNHDHTPHKFLHLLDLKNLIEDSVLICWIIPPMKTLEMPGAVLAKSFCLHFSENWVANVCLSKIRVVRHWALSRSSVCITIGLCVNIVSGCSLGLLPFVIPCTLCGNCGLWLFDETSCSD